MNSMIVRLKFGWSVSVTATRRGRAREFDSSHISQFTPGERKARCSQATPFTLAGPTSSALVRSEAICAYGFLVEQWRGHEMNAGLDLERRKHLVDRRRSLRDRIDIRAGGEGGDLRALKKNSKCGASPLRIARILFGRCIATCAFEKSVRFCPVTAGTSMMLCER